MRISHANRTPSARHRRIDMEAGVAYGIALERVL
jgi:hypothetical protein